MAELLPDGDRIEFAEYATLVTSVTLTIAIGLLIESDEFAETSAAASATGIVKGIVVITNAIAISRLASLFTIFIPNTTKKL